MANAPTAWLTPWCMQRGLNWDVTCVDTLAPSHIRSTRKRVPPQLHARISAPNLLHSESKPLTWGTSLLSLLKILSKNIVDRPVDLGSGIYLTQRISITKRCQCLGYPTPETQFKLSFNFQCLRFCFSISNPLCFYRQRYDRITRAAMFQCGALEWTKKEDPTIFTIPADCWGVRERDNPIKAVVSIMNNIIIMVKVRSMSSLKRQMSRQATWWKVIIVMC